MPIDPARARVCKSYTPGLTLGVVYVVRSDDGRLVEVVDDRGWPVKFWNWRFEPGPPVPPSIGTMRL
jgi:hypothetical protein